MKKILSFLFLLIAVSVHAQIENVIPARSNPPKLVNDKAGVLTAAQVEALERKLIAYNDSTSNQVAIVTVKSLTDPKSGVAYEDEEVALRILRDWGVGGKEHNNGIVILVSTDDRKIRIETGYGLEGAIPDITAKSIIDNSITPNFREGNYYRGFDRAVDDIMKAAAGEYKAPKGYSKNKGKSKGIGLGAIVFILILITIFGNRGGRGGGGMASRRGYRDFGTGWLLGTLLSGGGSGSGGGWSGGGGGGGGFGGFGGGSGGGGGASGSW
jgi:uncharacterized protein